VFGMGNLNEEETATEEKEDAHTLSISVPDTPKLRAPVEPSSKITSVVIAYMLCSSTMLIMNKAAVHSFPFSSFLLSLQTAFSAVVIFFAGRAGYLKVDALEAEKIKAYAYVVVVFIFNIYTNMKALEYSNVETVIVFQTLTSLVIAYGDYKLLSSGRPSAKVVLSLGIIVSGAICYMLSDSSFSVEAYTWVFLYFCAKTTEMLYVKHIIDTVPMTSWGRSFYNNLLAALPLFVFAVANGEMAKLSEFYADGDLTVSVAVKIFLSCVIGIGISISGFMCREAISATSFSVVGNMNKVLTVFINFFIWDKRASPAGLASLFICLVGGAYYAKVR